MNAQRLGEIRRTIHVQADDLARRNPRQQTAQWRRRDQLLDYVAHIGQVRQSRTIFDRLLAGSGSKSAQEHRLGGPMDAHPATWSSPEGIPHGPDVTPQ